MIHTHYEVRDAATGDTTVHRFDNPKGLIVPRDICPPELLQQQQGLTTDQVKAAFAHWHAWTGSEYRTVEPDTV